MNPIDQPTAINKRHAGKMCSVSGMTERQDLIALLITLITRPHSRGDISQLRELTKSTLYFQFQSDTTNSRDSLGTVVAVCETQLVWSL